MRTLVLWRKAWSLHQGSCDEDADRLAPACRNRIDATGLARLLAVLGTEDVHSPNDACRFGVAKIDSCAPLPLKLAHFFTAQFFCVVLLLLCCCWLMCCVLCCFDAVSRYAFGSGRPDASLDGVHYYAESGNKMFRMGNEVAINIAGALMSALF